jgi:hypothetical protein
LLGPIARRAARVSLVAVLLAASLPLATPVSAATLVRDPERNSTSLAAWGWHGGANPAVINNWVTSSGQRLIDIEVETPTAATPTFSAAYVANSGAYTRSWWWYYNQTAAQVTGTLTTNGARPIDVEPYIDGLGRLRYAVIEVANSGAAQKTWWWLQNQTVASIATFASDHNARPIDVDRYVVGGVTRFSAVLIANSGVDAAGWGHMYNAALTDITSWASANNMRIIQLERIPNSTNYDALLQSAGSENWWVKAGLAPGAVTDYANQRGARIYKIEPYSVNGTTAYAVLLINDANAETTRIRNLVSRQMTGSWGFFVKKVGAAQVMGLQPDAIFEPASMIKIVHAVRALREIQLSRTVTLATPIDWYVNWTNTARYPDEYYYKWDKNVCAYQSDGTLDATIKYTDPYGDVIIGQMMTWSDNRTTDAITRRFGFAELNNLMALAGMTRSHLYHRIGCIAAASPQPWHHNELTLRDTGRIYEGIENGTLLDAARRATLFGDMNGGVINPDGALAAMIKSEASHAGLTPAETAAFLSQVVTRMKGGSYDLCPDTGSCDPGVMIDRTAGGLIWLPVKSTVDGRVTTTQRAWVWGRYFNLTASCTFDSIPLGDCAAVQKEVAGFDTIAVEQFREIVQEALATW